MGFLKRSWRAFRNGRVWILGAVCLLLLSFWAVSGSETFQSCRAGEKSDFQDAVFRIAAAPAPPEQSDTSVEACLDYFLEENEPGIAALSVIFTTLFTGMLAISTIGLWNSTKNLHEETKRLATLAEAQSRDMRAYFTADQKSAGTAEQSLASLQDTSTRSPIRPDI
jgi:hypothetical protein